MIFHDLFAALSLIYLFCWVDTGVRVFVSVVFVVSFSLCFPASILKFISCKLASLFFYSQVILRRQYPFFRFHFLFYVISAVVLCRGKMLLLKI